MPYKVTVELLLEVDNEAAAFDAANEILREQQQFYTPSSCLYDYEVGQCCLVDYETPQP